MRLDLENGPCIHYNTPVQTKKMPGVQQAFQLLQPVVDNIPGTLMRKEVYDLIVGSKGCDITGVNDKLFLTLHHRKATLVLLRGGFKPGSQPFQ